MLLGATAWFDADKALHFVFPGTFTGLTRVKRRFIPWNLKTIPLGLDPFIYFLTDVPLFTGIYLGAISFSWSILS
jgi:hypothetical protein